jgi:thiosulfate dehydrogenase [quinone] large subunit
MTSSPTAVLSGAQQTALVVLRTLVGWHFLYEGFYKLWAPAWSQSGLPVARWTSAGYLRAATGPLAGLFRGLAEASWLPAVDWVVALGLVAVGLSLMLGLLTRAGCVLGLVFLGLFYLPSIPLAGVPVTGAEGAYLIVNKNVVEAAAILVLLVFGTGRIAGLDLLLAKGGTEADREGAAA